jgi:SAM-dependent methyltransferase
VSDHWSKYGQHWHLLEAPLRPTAETVAILEREAANAAADVLLLGVTPELAHLGRAMRAVDASPEMISALWKSGGPSRSAVVGSWLALPLESSSVDAVVADGSLNALATSAARRSAMREMARVIRPEGVAAIRIFTAPGSRETLAVIRDDALAGRIDGFHAFKWRVAMALTGTEPDHSIRVTEIRDVIDHLFPDRAALSAATGWSAAAIDTVDVYRGSETTYSFPTAARLVAEAEAFFEEVTLVPSGSYSLAERCPILVMRHAR